MNLPTSSSVRLLCVLPLAAFALSCDGCGGDPPGDDAGTGVDETAAVELCVAYTIGNNNFLGGVLHSFTRCSVTDGWPTVTADDLALVEESCVPGNEFYDQFVTAFAGGRVTIDVDAAMSCITQGRAAKSSSTIFEYNNGAGPLYTVVADADCIDAAVPRQGLGDECVQSWDCPDDTPCQADPPNAAGLRCLALAGEGEACGGARFCASGLGCVDEVCAPPVAAGQSCVQINGSVLSCVDGNFCDSEGTQVCQPLKPVGAMCVGGDCEADLVCDADTNLCAAPTPGLADGQPCDAAVDVCDSYCSVCIPNSAGGATTCQDRRAAGGYCESDNDCRGLLICDVGASECATAPVVELPGLGQTCDPVEGCAEGECVFDLCVAGEAGDVCDPAFSGCLDPLLCLPDVDDEMVGTCVSAPMIGEPCSQGACAFGAWCNPDDQCAALRGPGSTCAGGGECESGECRGDNTCGASSPSCYSSRGFFTQVLTLALLLPLAGFVRRRRR